MCSVIIEMYAEGLKSIMEQMPYVSSRYTVNTEKLKASISSDKYFCDNLALKIGSRMIEQMGENSVARVGLSLAAKTWDTVEIINKHERRANAKKFTTCRRAEDDNRAS